MVIAAAIVACVIASFAYLSMGLDRVFTVEMAREIGTFFAAFFPPDLSPPFLTRTARAAMETLAISAVGTLLAVVCSSLLALPASGRYGRVMQMATRLVLNLLRSIPELVWAAIMVLAAGLGPFAGTLALAAHTSGVLGRLFGEALENSPRAAGDALVQSGASESIAFLYGTLPAVLPQLVSYVIYRWEMNIRMAAILGFVGAGGLGQMLYFELSLLHEPQACTVVLATLALAAIVDTLSATVRHHLVRT